MGETRQACGLSDAARGRAPRGLAARSALKRFWADESGATAIEYGLIAGLIALVIIGGMTAFSTATNKALGKASTAIGT